MNLVLPREYPECLRRYEKPFGVFAGITVPKSHASMIQDCVDVIVVRALDCKQDSTHATLLEVMLSYHLFPFPASEFTRETLHDFLGTLGGMHSIYRHIGYVVTGLSEGNLIGWNYSFHTKEGNLEIAEQQEKLPVIIPLGYDAIFAAFLSQ